MTQVVERPRETEAPEIEMPKVDEASLLLERAAEVLEERGWTRHGLLDNQGRVCVLGALSEAAGTAAFFWPSNHLDQPGVEEALRRLANRLRFAGQLADNADEQEVVIYSWNDGEAEDGKQVARVLREVAAEGAR